MTHSEHKDPAASIRQRLLNWSRREQIDFQLALARYGIERLLYRLSCSPYCDRFVLKGAMLFIAWEGWSARPTRDVDLLGRGDPGATNIKDIFEALCRLEVEPDGLRFEPESIDVTSIRDDQDYGGQRVRLRAKLAQARIDLQVDIGFGDAVFPAPSRLEFPTLLNLPAPSILAYPRETVVAEKFHALVTLGMANSRMKDFYDLSQLAHQFDFDGAMLVGAIKATFERRQTPLPAEMPLALSAAFYEDSAKRAMWRAFLTRNSLTDGEQELEQVVQKLREFLLPLAMTVEQGKEFKLRWEAGGPWESSAK